MLVQCLDREIYLSNSKEMLLFTDRHLEIEVSFGIASNSEKVLKRMYYNKKHLFSGKVSCAIYVSRHLQKCVLRVHPPFKF